MVPLFPAEQKTEFVIYCKKQYIIYTFSFSLAEIFNTRMKKRKTHFEGKIVEALGEIWDWLNIPKQELTAYIQYITQNAFCLSHYIKTLSDHLYRFAQVYPRWPVGIRFLLTTTADCKQKTLNVTSFCILMKGYPNFLQIDETYAWKDGVEGYVSASTQEGPSVDFLAPLFYKEEENFQPNLWVTVYLSALALSLRPAKTEVFKVSEGALYEMMLKEFLQENPDKTKKDFPCVKISTQEMTTLLATEDTSFYQYRAKILRVFSMDRFKEIEIFNLLVSLVGDNPKNSLTIHLYAKKNDLNGYTPKQGDFIEGLLWMYGTTHFMTGSVPTDDEYTE